MSTPKLRDIFAQKGRLVVIGLGTVPEPSNLSMHNSTNKQKGRPAGGLVFGVT